MAITQPDLLARFLQLVADQMPPPLAPWGEAMLAELEAVHGFTARLGWVFGSVATLLIEWLKFVFARDRHRAWSVDAIAAYHVLFTVVLLGTLTWQLPRITESWKYALPALLLCYGIAVVPAVLGVGLVLRDNAARVATIVFSISHALLTVEFLRHSPLPAFSVLRIVVDITIIALLCRRSVRGRFAPDSVDSLLRGT